MFPTQSTKNVSFAASRDGGDDDEGIISLVFSRSALPRVFVKTCSCFGDRPVESTTPRMADNLDEEFRSLGEVSMQLAFIIPSGPDKNGRKATNPPPWERAGVRIAWSGNKPYPSHYTVKATKDAEELVAQYTMVGMRKNDIRKVTGEPLEITICFFFTKPASHSKTKIDRFPFPAITPDVDNLAKLVLDGMTDVLYTDDAKVVQLSAFKRYTHREAHTVVGVRSLEDHEAMPPWDVYDHLRWMKPFYHKDW